MEKLLNFLKNYIAPVASIGGAISLIERLLSWMQSGIPQMPGNWGYISWVVAFASLIYLTYKTYSLRKEKDILNSKYSEIIEAEKREKEEAKKEIGKCLTLFPLEGLQILNLGEKLMVAAILTNLSPFNLEVDSLLLNLPLKNYKSLTLKPRRQFLSIEKREQKTVLFECEIQGNKEEFLNYVKNRDRLQVQPLIIFSSQNSSIPKTTIDALSSWDLPVFPPKEFIKGDADHDSQI